MRKLLVGLLVAGALGAAVPAQASPPTHNGSFLSATVRSTQPHRVYFTVESESHGDKTCSVLLNGKTDDVSLGTDNVGSGMTFYLRVANAQKALAQALAAPSPTRRIVCSH